MPRPATPAAADGAPYAPPTAPADAPPVDATDATDATTDPLADAPPRDGAARDAGPAVTQLLRAHAAGDAEALGRLMPRVYDELRRIARARLRRERADHTLSTAEVVHEAFLDLLPPGRVDWQSRAHFFAVASRAMRNVLVDHAVRRGTAKRGAGARPLPLDDLLAEQVAAAERPLDDLIALNDALTRLEAIDPRRARVVECRFFGGMSLDETAAALGSSPATVSRDWTFARAWLHRELSGGRGATDD